MGKLVDAVSNKENRSIQNNDLLPIKNELIKSVTKRLNCDVPTQLYKQFQLKVIQEDTSITAVVNQLIYDYVDGAGKGERNEQS